MDNLQERIKSALDDSNHNQDHENYEACLTCENELKQLIRDMAAKIEELKGDVKDLENAIEARYYKFGDNCCACSYDEKNDLCMAHAPMVKHLESENQKLREAIQKTIDENLHLTDGENCTLRYLILALPQAPKE